MIVVGLDPSLTGLAVCKHASGVVTEHEFTSRPSGPSVFLRVQRFRLLTEQTCAAIFGTADVVVVYVEGHSFGSKGGKAFDRVEFRGVLYDRLLVGATVVEVAPTTLKMFAAGKGNADKIAVASALATRYQRSFSSDNAADAFGLMKLGLCVEGIEQPHTQQQSKAVETVRKIREAA